MRSDHRTGAPDGREEPGLLLRDDNFNGVVERRMTAGLRRPVDSYRNAALTILESVRSGDCVSLRHGFRTSAAVPSVFIRRAERGGIRSALHCLMGVEPNAILGCEPGETKQERRDKSRYDSVVSGPVAAETVPQTAKLNSGPECAKPKHRGTLTA